MPVFLAPLLGWWKSPKVQLPPSFLHGIYSVGCQLNLTTGVTRESICTLGNKSNILYFAAFAFFRDCYIFVTKELKMLPFFFVFLLVLNLISTEEWMIQLIWKFPYQNTRQGLSILFSWCVIQLYNIIFSYPVECSADSGSKCREYVQSLWLCLLFLVTTLGAWAMGNEMLWLFRGCMIPGVGKQSSGPTKYSAPGLFAPRTMRCRPTPWSILWVQGSETPGTDSSLPWVTVPESWCRSGWPQAKVY